MLSIFRNVGLDKSFLKWFLEMHLTIPSRPKPSKVCQPTGDTNPAEDVICLQFPFTPQPTKAAEDPECWAVNF